MVLAAAPLALGACVNGRVEGPARADAGTRDGEATPKLGPSADFLPARIRRLTNAELEATVAALLPQGAGFARGFAPDARQGAFTLNAAQRVDPLYAAQLQQAAHALGAQAAAGLMAGLGCSAGEACAERFIAGFVARAWRRPLAEDEKKDLLALFQAGASGGAFADGVALVVEAALQSTSFLHVTELGAGPPRDGLVRLAPHEVASALSYLVSGGPPDAALAEAAARGGLDSPAAREAEARRLLGTPGARRQVRRFIEEWLALDRLAVTGKDLQVYPAYDDLRPQLAAETEAFLAEVVFADDGTLRRLLTADYTVVGPELGRFYGIAADASPAQRTPLGGGPRRGLLLQASFLSVHAHAGESAPVKRGAAVLERLLCHELPRPSQLELMVVPPRPDPQRTTRERFEVHARDPVCATCHARIDPVGFAFEAFDGMGQHRTEENFRRVVTAAELAAGSLQGPVADAVALVEKLAANPDVEACFARNLFRFAAADASARIEEAYLTHVWAKLPAGKRTDVKELLASLAASELFVTRRVAP